MHIIHICLSSEHWTIEVKICIILDEIINGGSIRAYTQNLPFYWKESTAENKK